MELFYSSGGHTGPFASRAVAREFARRLLRGAPREQWIEIRASSTSLDVLEVVDRGRGLVMVDPISHRVAYVDGTESTRCIARCTDA